MTTKNKIEETALDLFSAKGYDGVSVREIAALVGIRESSIYKHYKGKGEIFNTIKDHYLEKTAAVFGALPINPVGLTGISAADLISMIKVTFQAFATDAYISKCRKLFMISAPGNPEIGALYAGNFITAPIAYNTSVFEAVIVGRGLGADAESMAYQFYAPVFCILQEYDNSVLTMAAALAKIDKITGKFLEVYGL